MDPCRGGCIVEADEVCGAVVRWRRGRGERRGKEADGRSVPRLSQGTRKGKECTWILAGFIFPALWGGGCGCAEKRTRVSSFPGRREERRRKDALGRKVPTAPAPVCPFLTIDARDVAEDVAQEVDVVDRVDCAAVVSAWKVEFGASGGVRVKRMRIVRSRART